ncbi:beta-alanyl-dopamine/carcinine hydrolase-like [Haliotis cracherodii]|uniref:beta-alanyl-dopamine/carcinine hydrolase-like n=1 Tax=Haliotis cracherodii TaxID=6455 RepID=UPI0039ED15E5
MKTFMFLVATAWGPLISGVSFPELHTIGTNYQIGLDMGRTFRGMIQEFYNQSSSLAKVTQFLQTDAGKTYYSGYFEAVTRVFPEYVKELSGLADGAGVSFTQAFSMMISSEIKAVMKLKGAESCSDVYLADQQMAIGHNEDADPLLKERSFLVHATVVGGAGDVENFTAYTYAGALSGNAFSFNGDGKVFTVNALYPNIVEANKIPRYFMNRALLGVKSQGDLEHLLHGLGVGVAYGFNVNYADIRNSSGILTNYEVSPMKGVSQNLVTKATVARQSGQGVDTTGHYYHFNMYEHTNVTQIPKDIVSSQHRKARANQLPPPADVVGVTVILGDQGDSQYPIYRTPRPSDEEATIATGIFVLDSCVLLLFKSNPRTTARPITTINLPRGAMCGQS